jgi:ribosomal protein L31
MKKGLHPEYRDVIFWDTSSDYKFLSRSTLNTKETAKWTLIQPVVLRSSRRSTTRNKQDSGILTIDRIRILRIEQNSIAVLQKVSSRGRPFCCFTSEIVTTEDTETTECICSFSKVSVRSVVKVFLQKTAV